MRTLRFIVDKQVISQDHNCDFSGLIPGTKGYLQAEFIFSQEWKDCVKVAAFYSRMGKEYPPQALDNNNMCVIPEEALAKSVFSIRILGKTKDNLRLTTNKIQVFQNGGK